MAGYQHDFDNPLINNLHTSMELVDGFPHQRVTLGSDNITITGNVNVATEIRVNNTDLQSIPVRLTATPNVNVNNWPASQAVTGTFWPDTQAVSGTVNINSMPEVEIKNDSGNPIPVSWVYGGGATLIPWEVQVARGKISGVTNLNISGYNSNVGTVFAPLWHNTTAFVYPASASTMRVWSDNAADTNVSVLVTGLDANYNVLTETVTLTNGATGVMTTGQFLRINNLSITRTPMNTGVIFCGNSAKTEYYCTIEIGAGRSQQTIYTVPAGYTFYLTQSNFYTNNTGNNVGLYRSYTVSPAGVVNIILTSPFPVTYNSRKVAPRPYPEKTDIQWQVSSKSGSAEVGGQIEGYLIANSVS
jgi:hypothetical protein